MTAGELPARPSGSAKPQSGAARRDYWDAAPGPLAGSAVQRRLASDLAISLQQSPMALLQPSMRTISQPAAQRIGPLASQEPYDTGTKVRQISDISASTPASAANAHASRPRRDVELWRQKSPARWRGRHASAWQTKCGERCSSNGTTTRTLSPSRTGGKVRIPISGTPQRINPRRP